MLREKRRITFPSSKTAWVYPLFKKYKKLEATDGAKHQKPKLYET